MKWRLGRRLHVTALAMIALVGAGALSLVSISPTLATSTTTTTSSSTTTTAATGTTTTTAVSPPTTTTTTIPKTTSPSWPTQGSAAFAIPQLSVAAASRNQPEVPIASLTKMMTVWVILHQLPLSYSQQGPCLVVNARDVALYDSDVATDQSNARIVRGERLCEGMLLRGLLVHSAGDYAELLLRMMGVSTGTFVREMNRDATALALHATHYVDYTGISNSDRSTAQNQTTLAVALMSAEPIVRSIVALPRVALPHVGVVGSYTPLIGTDGVVGVKSGFTTPAGGCDVMAINMPVGATVVTTYAVVLGERGADSINHAGDAALALARSLRSSYGYVRTPVGRTVTWTGSPIYVVPPGVPTTTTTTPTTTVTTTTLP